MRFSIDRIEEGRAVLLGDDGSTLEIDRGLLPDKVLEGDILRHTKEGFVRDTEVTESRRLEAQNLLNKILNKGKEN